MLSWSLDNNHIVRLYESLKQWWVNNSININKTNIQLSPQLNEHKNDHDIYIGNPGPDLGQAQKCGRVKPVYGINTLPSR